MIARVAAAMSTRRLLRRSLGGALAAALLGTVLGVAPASAVGVDEARDRVERILAELERLEEEVDILTEDYVVAVDEKNRLDAEVEAARARIAEKEAALAELQSELSAAAVAAFVSGGTGGSLTGLLAPGSSPTDAVKKQQLTELALDAGGADTDELDALITDLEAERAGLEAKQKRAEEYAASLSQRKAAAEQSRAEFMRARAEAEAELGEALAREEQRRQEEALRQAEELLRQQAAAARAPAAPRAGSSGGGSSGSSSSSGGGSSGSSGGGSSPSDGGGQSAPPPSSRAGVAIQAARSQLGVPYRFAASEPGVAFDCSGLTKYAWGQAGVYLPHQSRAQYASVPHVPKSQAQPGDLIFYYSPISHVGIYLGGGQLIHAPATGDVVKISSVNWGRVVGVGRPG